VLDPSDNVLKTKKQFLASYGPSITEQNKALEIWNNSKKVIFEDLVLHGSCDDKSQHSVLYVEEDVDSSTGKSVKILYCFDLSELYDKLTSSSGTFTNDFSGKPFSDEFIQMIQNITAETIRDIKEKNEYLSSLQKLQEDRGSKVKTIQRWFRRTRNKKDLIFKNNSKWALTFLLDLRPVKDYIEENKPEAIGEEGDEDEELDIDEDLFGSEDEDLFGSEDEDEDLDIDDDVSVSENSETEDEDTESSFSMGKQKPCCRCPNTMRFQSIKEEGVNPKSFCFCGAEECFSKFSFKK